MLDILIKIFKSLSSPFCPKEVAGFFQCSSTDGLVLLPFTPGGGLCPYLGLPICRPHRAILFVKFSNFLILQDLQSLF